MRKLIILLASVYSIGCTPLNLDDVKLHSDATWDSLGFDVVGYDGYQWGFWGVDGYGGAKVWYIVERKNSDNDILYGGYLSKWGDEHHMYSFRAYDAIRPR